MDDGIMTPGHSLVDASAFSVLQCLDAIGWVTGTASDP